MAHKLLRVLSIETSCDETGAALISGDNYPIIESNIIASQIDLHKITGGVVPEVAARAHCESIIPVIEQALGGAIHTKIKDIDAIAVTVGPGLVGSLLVGVETAKALAFASGKPLIPINHLEGHIFAALQQRLNSKFEIRNTKQIQNNNDENSKNTKFGELDNLNLDIVSDLDIRASNLLPALALVVSGGHTQLVLIKDLFDYEIIGQTMDDAAGEAFDKVASLLGLAYPGGPAIAKLAEEYKIAHSSQAVGVSSPIRATSQDPRAKIQELTPKLPRPMLHSKDLNFSFSGLKTAVVNLVKSEKLKVKSEGLPADVKEAIAYEFQEAVVEVLLEKTWQAIQTVSSRVIGNSQQPTPNSQYLKSILLTGGVSANKRLREAFQERFGDKLLVSPLELCGDNAGMIGLAAWQRLQVKSEKLKVKRANQKLKIIRKSNIKNLKSHFAWQNVDVDPNLEL